MCPDRSDETLFVLECRLRLTWHVLVAGAAPSEDRGRSLPPHRPLALQIHPSASEVDVRFLPFV